MEEEKIKNKEKFKNTKQRGITLIALVITIIVLLILAGVSIAMLTGENGILTQAQKSSEQTEFASVKEQAQLDISNYVVEKLKNGEDPTVNTPEKVQEILDGANAEENRYYAGYTETGVKTPSGYEVPYEELYTTGTSGEETTSKTVEDLKLGDKVTYIDKNNNEIECVVLYDASSGYGVQVISKDVVGEDVTLGVGYADASKFEASKEDYNNALKILYDNAQEYLNTTYASSARCVGSDPADPDWDVNENEAGYYTKEIAEENKEYESYMENYYNILKNGDEKYNTDWMQMEQIPGIKTSNKDYWLASRVMYANSYTAGFSVVGVFTSGDLEGGTLCLVYSDSAYGYGYTFGFRPVFTLKSGIKITEGDGVNTPYKLEV